MPALVFATWNVHGCEARLSPFESAAIADVLAGTGADVIALQETAMLDAGYWTSGYDQIGEVASLLGMSAVFGANVTRRSGRYRYGNAILSKFPVVDSENHDLSLHPHEPRGCLVARVRTPAGDLRVASAHFGLRASERAWQARRVAETVLRDDGTPTILGGDMNDWLPGRATRALRARLSDAWQAAGAVRGTRATYPAALPVLRLDHVYVTPHFDVRACAPVRDRRVRAASDHLPLVATLGVLLPSATACAFSPTTSKPSSECPSKLPGKTG